MSGGLESKSLTDTSISFSPVLGSVFGVCGALLLQQIHFFCCSSSNYRDGHTWVWNTTKDWAENIGVFDERTIRYTLKSLREKGVVVTGEFNKHKYDKTLWYRVDYLALLKVVEDKDPTRKFHPAPLGKFFRMVEVKSSAPIPKSTTENTTKSSLASLEPEPTLTIVSPEDEVLPKNGLKKGPTNASEVVANLLTPPAVKKETMVMSLYRLWATHVPRNHEEVKFVGAFTMQQKGMVSMLGKSWAGDAGAALVYLIENWTKFGKYVNAQVGVKSYPSYPRLDYLVKNKDLGMNFYLSRSKVKDGVLGGVQTPAVSCTLIKGPGKVILKKGTPPDAVQTLTEPSTVDQKVNPLLSPEDDEDEGPQVSLEFLLKQKFGKV